MAVILNTKNLLIIINREDENKLNNHIDDDVIYDAANTQRVRITDTADI